jgi:predicted DNA-binding transcriptional regulator YafY
MSSLKEYNDDELMDWSKAPRQSIRESSNHVIRSILAAKKNSAPMDIRYMGGSAPGEMRRITPVDIFTVKGYSDIYVSAYCHVRNEERTFRLDRLHILPNGDRTTSPANSIVEQILSIINDKPGLKAGQIADKIGIDRKVVNSIIYGNLRDRVQQDKSYRWYPKKAGSIEKQDEQLKQLNTPLARLCRYYLDCISHDDLGGVSEVW